MTTSFIIIGVILIIGFRVWWKNNCRSYYFKGLSRFRMREWEKAIGFLEIANRKNPRNWKVLYYLGFCTYGVSLKYNEKTLQIKRNAIMYLLYSSSYSLDRYEANNFAKKIIREEENKDSRKKLIDYIKELLKSIDNFNDKKILTSRFDWLDAFYELHK